jgi:hypothetical protein
MVMLIPGLDAMVVEEEALALMSESGILTSSEAAAIAEEETEVVYRVYGDGSGAPGRSWTPVNPNSVSNYRAK